MPIMQKTIDYLLFLLDQPYVERFLSAYKFLWNRMRAIRMNLRMQHIFYQGAILCLNRWYFFIFNKSIIKPDFSLIEVEIISIFFTNSLYDILIKTQYKYILWLLTDTVVSYLFVGKIIF